VGAALLAGILLFGLWLFFTAPRLINPYRVMRELQAGTLERGTLELMALLLPVAVLALWLTLLSLVLFIWSVLRRECWYLEELEHRR
jgi:hypothetical protein